MRPVTTHDFTPDCSPCGAASTPARFAVRRQDGSTMPACEPCAAIARDLGRPVVEIDRKGVTPVVVAALASLEATAPRGGCTCTDPDCRKMHGPAPEQPAKVQPRLPTPYVVLRRQPAMGRTRELIRCPFCRGEVWAYVWSLCGGGKRCDCGAMLTRSGAYTKAQWYATRR